MDGTQAFELHHRFGLLSLLTTPLQVPVEEIHHLHHKYTEKRTDGMGSGREHIVALKQRVSCKSAHSEGQIHKQVCQTVCIEDRYLSAAPGQASGDPVDGDVQVVHLPVVVWSRKVVGAETAEKQRQEEVQQLEADREGRGQFHLLQSLLYFTLHHHLQKTYQLMHPSAHWLQWLVGRLM